jgi:hypothetical protein
MIHKKRSASLIWLLAGLPRDILICVSIFAVTLTIVTVPGSAIRGPLSTAKRV